MPFPLSKLTQIVGPLMSNLACEQDPKTINPVPNVFMTNVYAAFMKQVFGIAKWEWKSDVRYHSASWTTSRDVLK
jgi:hypothetical protein